jgi:hypothetical protein
MAEPLRSFYRFLMDSSWTVYDFFRSRLLYWLFGERDPQAHRVCGKFAELAVRSKWALNLPSQADFNYGAIYLVNLDI